MASFVILSQLFFGKYRNDAMRSASSDSAVRHGHFCHQKFIQFRMFLREHSFPGKLFFQKHCYYKEEITLTLSKLRINSQLYASLTCPPMTRGAFSVLAMAGIHILRYIKQQNDETATKERGGIQRKTQRYAGPSPLYAIEKPEYSGCFHVTVVKETETPDHL